MMLLFKQTWWNDNLKNSKKLNEFLGWIGDTNAQSRVVIRDKIKNLRVKSIADFGCSSCVEYRALTSDNYKFEYLGIDCCVHLEKMNISENIPFLNSYVEDTGLDENSYELSYSRHVLEHLPKFEDALNEMIRVASKYVVHIFFMKPQDKYIGSFWKNENLYHNTYCIFDIENFLKNNSKVECFEWIDINDQENALFITLINNNN